MKTIMKENMKGNLRLGSLRDLLTNGSESLKSLKILMQIFGNLVNLVNLVMQIFKRPAVVSVRTVPVESSTKVLLKSRIPSYLPLLATVLMLTFGGWNSVVKGATAKIEQEEFNGNREWSGPHANFVISGTDWSTTTVGGDGRKLQLKSGNTYTIEWTVSPGYTINVTEVRSKIGAPSGGYDLYFNEIKCGSVGLWSTKDNVFLGGLSLDDNGSISVRATGTCNIYYLKITYTITPDAPSVSPTTTSVNVTPAGAVSNTTINVASYFASSDHMTKSYSLTYNPTGFGYLSDSVFYATKAGTYQVKANYTAETDCHEASGLSAPLTITVNRLTPTLTLVSPATGEVDITNDVESPNYFNLASLISSYIGDGRSYSVSSANSAYAHFSGDNFYATEAGDYTIRISSPQGDQYTGTFNDDATYREVTITVRDKARPSFAMNYLQSAADGLLVEDTIENAFTFTNISNDANFTWNITPVINSINNGNGKVISYDKENNKIIAHNAGTATLQFVQTETGAIDGGSSAVYTFTVSKYETSFSGSAYNMMVEGTQTANYSYTNTSAAKPTANSGDDFYYAVENVVFTNSEKNSGVNFVTFNPENKLITACNAGTGTITLRQKETYKFTGDTVSFNVAVYKYNGVFTGIANFNDVLVDNSVTSEYVLTYTKPEDAYVGENHEAGVPASEGAFRYAVAHEVQTENVVGSPDGSIVIAYDPSTKVATGKNKGVGTVTLTQDETYKYNGATTSFNVNVIKRTPVFTWDGSVETNYSFEYYFNSVTNDIFQTTSGSEQDTIITTDNEYSAMMLGDSLMVYNVAEVAHITIRQLENYKWNAHEKTYTITPQKENNHVPFTYSEEKYNDGSITTKSGASYWGDAGYETAHLVLGEQDGDKYVVIHISGVPDKLTFYCKTNSGSASNVRFYVQESATSDFSASEVTWDLTTNYHSDWAATPLQTVQLAPTTRYVKIGYGGTKLGRIKDIYISELEQFETDPATEFDFGLQGQNYGKQEEVINFYHANAGRVTTARILDGTDAEYFSVTPAEISGTGRDIVGSNTLIVSFDNKTEARAENEYYEADLYISDNAGNETTLRLKGRRHGKSYPKFTFNPNHVPYYFNDTIHNIVASTNTEAKIDVTSSDNSIAEIVDGKLVIKDKKAEVTITVSQEEIGDFRAHEQEFKFTPHEEPPLVVPFIMSKAIYDDAAMVISKGEDVSWTEDGCIRSGWSDWQATASGRYFNSKKEFVVAFSGVPDKLSFKAKNTYASINCRWKVEQRSEGGDWQTVFYKSQSCQDWVEFTDIQLDPKAQYLRFQYGGNYTGYFKDIQVSCIDGVKYMLAGDGQYLSRGGEYGTRAIVDEFGLPIKVTRSTTDNETYTTQVQFLDSRQYLYEAGGTYVYTDNKVAGSNATKWRQIVSDGKVKVQSANSREEGDRFITVVNGNLTMTADAEAATIWEVEDYTIHAERIEAKLNRRAAEAAYHDFGEEMNTMEKVRAMLEEEDFDYTSIEIDAVSPTEQKGEYRDPSGAFAVYDQEITDLEPGFYRLKVQALYKPSPSPIDWENHAKGYESVVSYVYANDFKFPIKSVYDITGRHTALVSGDTLCGGYYYPANLASATTAFTDLNTYMHDLYVYVEADEDSETGTLRYGIVNQSYVPGVWMAYGGFILEKIARKTYIFDGGTEGTGTTWGTAANWDYQNGRESVPGEKNAVVIKSDVEVTGQFKVFSIEVHDDAKVSIAPTGGLTIGAGGVKYITSKKSAPTSIVLEAETTGENKGKTGFLRVSPDYSGELPEVEVQLYSVGYYDRASEAENVASWQHVGCPIEFEGKAKEVFTRSWIYSYQEANDKWVNNRSTLEMQPFVGYATTQYDDVAGKLLTFSGKLLPSDSVYTVDLAYTDDAHGHNMVANSFAAPIDITNFKDADFVNAEKTIYIFNTGTRQNYLDDNAAGNSAGQWTAIPIRSLSEMNTFFAENTSIPSTIAPMQGFCVNATGAGAKMVFDYNRLVWNADYSTHQPKPMRSPKRALAAQEEEQPITGAMKISVEAEGWSDDVYMLESERYSYEYEDGYDARKMESGNFNIFTVRDGEQLAIDANPDFEGTQIGVRTGEATAYTMHFSNLFGEREWALVDVEAEETIDIREGTEYTFFIEPNSTNLSRFYLIEQHSQAPAVTTGVDNAEDDAKVHKFIKDDKLFILKSGVLYDATGARVK